MRESIIEQEKIKQTDVLRIVEEEEANTGRTNFSSAEKAEIYARDRAICAFTGMNLWLLDEGVGGFYNTCCIDHIIPASKGGSSTVDNSVATFAAYNHSKGNNIGANLYLFLNGLPTYRFWQYHRLLTLEMAQRISNNSQIQPSDYSFNQAIMTLICGVYWLHSAHATGQKRDDDYYALSSLRGLEKWRKAVDSEGSSSLEDRNLVPVSLTPDQELLLSLRQMKTTKQIKALMTEVLPYHSANLALRLEFEVACEKWTEGSEYADSFSIVDEMLDQPFVSAIVANQIGHNMNMMIAPFAPWGDEEAMKKYNEEIKSGEVN